MPQLVRNAHAEDLPGNLDNFKSVEDIANMTVPPHTWINYILLELYLAYFIYPGIILCAAVTHALEIEREVIYSYA